MMLVVFEIFRASRALQGLLAVIAVLAGFKLWQKHERAIGARVVTEQITKKADDNAKQAEAVRDAVTADKPGRVRSPYERAND